MGKNDSGVTAIRPIITQCRSGQWLAVSERGASLTIGVLGVTPDDARSKFAERIAAWDELLATEPEVEPGSVRSLP